MYIKLVSTWIIIGLAASQYFDILPSAMAQNDLNVEFSFTIWPESPEISDRWYADIKTQICPDPEIPVLDEEKSQIRWDPETKEPAYPGSQIVISYVATMADGTNRDAEYEYVSSTNDLCKDPISHRFGFLEVGQWSISAKAKWISADDGSIQQIQSNTAAITVRPAMYKSTNSETLGLNADNYPLLKLLDWSSDGKSILVAYDNTYNASVGIDPRTTPSIETGVLGIMDPDGHKIRPLDLPVHFRYFTDARFSPSSDNVLLIMGSAYEFENQATVFEYELQNNKLDPLPEIEGYAIMVPDKDGDGYDDIVFGKEIRDSADQDELKTLEIWLANSTGSIVEKLYEQTVDDEAGFQIEDSSADGNEILITVNKKSDFPISENDLAIFDIEARKLETILSSTNTASARFAPFSGLVLYNIGPGYKTPAGPLYIMTTDGSYREELLAGQRVGTVDSPASYVVSPDGRYIVAAVQVWGSGDQYITKTQLAQAIPEFGSLTALIAALTLMTAIAGFAIIRRDYL